MDNLKSQEDLSVIRNLMEQSTKFMSLSGLSGVFIGIYALIGSATALWYINSDSFLTTYFEKGLTPIYITFGCIAFGVLSLSLITAFMLSKRKAKKLQVGFWNKSAKLMIYNLAIPLITGGLFSGLLIYHNAEIFIPPVTLIFYGLALIQASQVTVKEIKFLGLLEILTGLIAFIKLEYDIYFWAFGFGILHILYGIIIYYKYDRKA